MRTHLRGLFLFCVVCLLVGGVSPGSLADVQASSATSPVGELPLAHPSGDYATTIVIDSTTDPDDSLIRTCTYDSGTFTPSEPCTLRRAIVEASARPPADRPILISFDLPTSDPNYADEVAGTWSIQVNDALPPLRTQSITNLTGQVMIDGSTQPQGRSTADGPRIIVNSAYSLEVESTGNTIRNLSWKGGGAIFLKEDGNTVENIWMGLSDDGTSLALEDESNPQGLSGGGIVILASSENVVQNNVIAGSTSRAINISGSGDDNIIRDNFVGTRADGTVPEVAEFIECLRDSFYDESNWYGGWGIGVSGRDNQVLNNTIAGLHQTQTANETPPMALEIFGSGHLIQGNVIGLDSAGHAAGVCGQGIKVAGNGTEILDNTIVRSRPGFEGSTTGDPIDSAILVNDSSPTFGEITIRGNIIRDTPDTAIKMGPAVDEALALFKPAAITSIDGTTVEGTSGAGSPCPNCRIDLYLDDSDETEESFELLASVMADSSGNWSATLDAPLEAGFGIRTASTTSSSGVIPRFGPGTTTEYSELYMESGNQLFLPFVTRR